MPVLRASDFYRSLVVLNQVMFKNNIPNVLRKVLEQHHPGALVTLKDVVPVSLIHLLCYHNIFEVSALYQHTIHGCYIFT